MGNFSFFDIMILIFIIIAILGAILYFLNKWAYKKMATQQSLIERTTQTMSIYVIDKKRDKLTNANFPKAMVDQIPKYNKFMKMNLVKAKVGPQIVTLICDKNVYKALPVKKNVKVDIAGLYITNMKGMKTKKEMKELAKQKHKKS